MLKEKSNLSIFRIKKDRNFVIVSKTLINDLTVSWKAKGILIYLLSKPDNWELVIGDIISHSTDGRDKVYSGLKELETAGYIKRSREKSKKNRYIGYVYFVYEKPRKR